MVVDGTEYGEVRQYGNFSFLRVYEAGHEVPFYQRKFRRSHKTGGFLLMYLSNRCTPTLQSNDQPLQHRRRYGDRHGKPDECWWAKCDAYGAFRGFTAQD